MGPAVVQILNSRDFNAFYEGFKAAQTNYKYMEGLKITDDNYITLVDFCLWEYGMVVYQNGYTVVEGKFIPRMVVDADGNETQEVDAEGNAVYDNVQTETEYVRLLVNL